MLMRPEGYKTGRLAARRFAAGRLAARRFAAGRLAISTHHLVADGPPSPPRSSPDSHPILRRKKKLLAWLHIEGLVPGIHVSHHAVHAVLHRRVRRGHDLPAHRVVG